MDEFGDQRAVSPEGKNTRSRATRSGDACTPKNGALFLTVARGSGSQLASCRGGAALFITTQGEERGRAHCVSVGIALSVGMHVQVVPGDPPIRVRSVVEVVRAGKRCWHIEGVSKTVRRNASGVVQERTTYTVPVSYNGLKFVA